jgi:hypothetical protein
VRWFTLGSEFYGREDPVYGAETIAHRRLLDRFAAAEGELPHSEAKNIGARREPASGGWLETTKAAKSAVQNAVFDWRPRLARPRPSALDNRYWTGMTRET